MTVHVLCFATHMLRFSTFSLLFICDSSATYFDNYHDLTNTMNHDYLMIDGGACMVYHSVTSNSLCLHMVVSRLRPTEAFTGHLCEMYHNLMS